jgi:hypothetical protein
MKKQLSAQLADAARDSFSEDSELGTIKGVSVSTKSINSMLEWLRELKPSCMSESMGTLTFRRRPFCPPELMLLATGFLYEVKQAAYSSIIVLTEENIDSLCRICLLEREAFNEVLGWSVRQFSFLESEANGGGWGRYLVLIRKPRLTDLI